MSEDTKRWGGNRDADYPWESPVETGEIPQETKKWVAVAVMNLGDALSCRTDTPAVFASKVKDCLKALGWAADALHQDFKTNIKP